MKDNAIGVYIHIPFCIKKCRYCDFVSFPAGEDLKRTYMEALLKEIRMYGMRYGKDGTLGRRSVATVFLGGGTPSVIDGLYIERLIGCLRDLFDFCVNAEITIECNPGTLNPKKLSEYKRAGINRLSIGLQSANDSQLRTLGRIHSYSDFKNSFAYARQAGFDNINVDIMSALPGQSLSSYMETLNAAAAFEPEHISAYSLIIEEGTPFYDMYRKNDGAVTTAPLPDEATEREMYYKTKEILLKYGYHRYEISNYSRKGRECAHNLGYWRRREYLGFGLNAASFMSGVRFKNIADIDKYITILNNGGDEKILSDEYDILSQSDAMAEFMFLGLRTMEGIRKSEFALEFGRDVRSVYGEQLDRFSGEGLLEEEGDFIRLTERGIDLSNYVFAEFILD